MLQNRRRCNRCGGKGRLPEKGPLAYPFVPFQGEQAPKYEPRQALVRGTLYSELDLPFMGMVNCHNKPQTALTELQAISFAINDLVLYLDTHRDDQEAIAKYRELLTCHKELKARYEDKYGPLTNRSDGNCGFRWLDDPWPWEYAMNREV